MRVWTTTLAALAVIAFAAAPAVATHSKALKTFLAKDLDPEVKGKLEKLMAGGLRIDACQITLKRQKLELRELLEGLTAVPSGVARVMELQELGYTYVRP